MSIIITNVGKPEDAQQEDEREYVLRINQDEIVRFRHNRNDGLYSCLSRAAYAVLETEDHGLGGIQAIKLDQESATKDDDNRLTK